MQDIQHAENTATQSLLARFKAFFKSKNGRLSLLLCAVIIALILVLSLGDSPEQLEELAIQYYEQPEFSTLNQEVPEAEAAAIIRSAFIQHRWESAFYDIARTKPEAANFTEAKYVEAHIHFVKKEYSKADELFDQVIRRKDNWYSPRAVWYQALCALAEGQKNRTLTRLKLIAASSEHPHYQSARRLLSQIK